MKNFWALFLITALLWPRSSALASTTTTVGSWNVTVTDLGVLPGGTASRANAINDAGLVVGMSTDASFALQRIIWDTAQGNAIVANVPNYDPSSTAEPSAINNLGELAGTERISSTLREGVYWPIVNGVYGVVGLKPLNNGSMIQITANDINDYGTIVGSAQDGSTGNMDAVTWNRDSVPTSLGLSGVAYGINNLGDVVGVYSSGALSKAFIYRNGQKFDLNAVSGPTVSSSATAANNTGLVAGTSDGSTIAVTWGFNPNDPSASPSGPTVLPLPTGYALPSITGINDGGDVVGTVWNSSFSQQRAVLWRNGQPILLASFNSKAFGINTAGQIVGVGDVNGTGLDRALVWVVTPSGITPPPPPPPPANTSPVITSITLSSNSVKVGDTVALTANFTDPDNGPWAYTIDWGDGYLSTGSVASPANAIVVWHLYTKPGPKKGYKVLLRVTDAAGASASALSQPLKVSR